MADETILAEPSDISTISIVDEMRSSYLDYAMSVIVARALPDVRDGLKPVHRRILYACQEGGFVPGRPYRKSSRIVGDVMGKYHPHADASIYDALASLAQDWSMRVPLIDGQGNFGSMDPDPPASMRYTEARLARVANFLLGDVDKDTVDFTPNYDGSGREPTVLPARFPNLLVNGAGGIAVGMATNVPPHNLGEVIDACLALIDNGAITTEELMEIVPDSNRKPYDMYEVIAEIVDDGEWFDLKPRFARSVITCLARFGGVPVGIVAVLLAIRLDDAGRI